MAIRIHSTFRGETKVLEIDKEKILFGRTDGAIQVDVDLPLDLAVSRKHAALQVKMGVGWLLDVGSSHGTQVNGCEIKHQGEWQLKSTDKIRMGETDLQIEVFSLPENLTVSEFDASLIHTETQVRILQTMDTDVHESGGPASRPSTLEARLTLLADLPAQFCEVNDLDSLFPLIMQRVMDVIPAAKRGALLLRDPERNTLILKTFISATSPAVSETLARRALNEKRGYIWQQETGDVPQSVRDHRIKRGMYAPLAWKDQALGVICVDSPDPGDAFTTEDLRLLMAVAQSAAITLATRQLQMEMESNAKILERLLSNFSPKIRSVLVEQARHGRLRPGGRKSEVTLLLADLCGFTTRTARMDTADVVDMLNEYYPALTEAVFRFDGSIDKFIGDAVLAVFGSPEPDAQQDEKAVRAAMAMQAAMHSINQQRAARDDAFCELCIGVHRGEVLHGFIGGVERLEFTVIGDAVNRTSRYCQGANDGEVLVSLEVYQRVFKLVQAEKTTFQAKEGQLTAYRIKEIR